METAMNRLAALAALATLVAAPLASPVAAQSLSVLLPVLAFPGPVMTPSTKDCVPATTTDCTSGQ
jgi:hypothetical protein